MSRSSATAWNVEVSRRPAVAYAVSIATVAVAVGVRWLLDGVLHAELALVTLYGPVAFAAWVGGLGPALVVIVGGYVACSFLFIEPRYVVFPKQANWWVGLLAYLVTCGIIVLCVAALRRAQRTVGTQAETLSITLQSIGDAIVTTDARGLVTFLNPVAETLTGWTTAVAKGRPLDEVLQLINEQTREPVENPVGKVLRDGQVVGMANHTILVARDGTERPIDDSAAPIYGMHGELSGVVLVFRDISDRRAAELTAHKNERDLDDLFEKASLGLYWVDSDGEILRVNQTELDILGYQEEEFVGKAIADFFVDQELIRDLLARLAGGENVKNLSAQVCAKDGSIRDVLLHCNGLFERGRLVHSRCFMLDITEQKRAQDAVVESEARFRLLADAAAVLIWMSGPNKQAIYFNQAWLDFTGKPVEEQVGEGWLDQVHPEDRQPVVKAYGDAFHGREPFTTEFRLRRADGDYRWMLDNGTPRVDSNGIFLGFIGTCVDISDRKSAEEAQLRLAAIVESSEDAIISKSLDGVIQSWNSGAERIFGYTAEEAVGQMINLLIPPELWDEERAILGRLRRGETIAHFDTIRVAKNGQRLNVSLTISPVRDKAGRIIGASKVGRDVTKRHLDEQALRDSEQRLRLALEAGRMGTWEWSVSQNEVTWSPSLEALHGLEAGTFPGTFEAYQSDIHPADREKVQQAIEQTLAGSDEHHIEYRIIWPDGSLHWVEGRGKLFRDDSGAPLRMIGVCTDITERKRSEEALRTSEQLYRAIGESIDFGVWVCAPDGRNIYASESFLALVGMTQTQCSDMGWADVLHPDDIENTVVAWQECVRTGATWDIEHRFRGADGAWHPVLARGVPVRNEQGEITAWAGINLDISRLKDVEDELREADRRKDEFLATLAHELRNPLAPIRNALELTKRAGHDPELMRTAHQMMERQLVSLVRLVDDLLDVSRITRDRLELRREHVELASVIYQAVEAARSLVEEFRHNLIVDLPAEPIYLDADPVRLSQVFSNLLNNACKYTEPGGSIRIAAMRAEHELVVKVSDSGIGITAEMMPRVFDMFAQMDHSLDRTQGGLGIGLSLVKRLVELHGGVVEARSEGLGRGSEFVVRLPLELETRRVDGAPPHDVAASSGGRRILVVDDNQDAANWLAMLLKTAGHETHVAFDGQEAIRRAHELRPEVVLMDIGLPHLNGYDACRAMRGEEWGKSMVIVALTGWGQEDDRRKSKEAGFDGHLVKPIDHAALDRLLADGQPAENHHSSSRTAPSRAES